jgi:hypothetical protein
MRRFGSDYAPALGFFFVVSLVLTTICVGPVLAFSTI